MQTITRKLRLALCASTALTFSALAAQAQSTALNLGSVTATGNSGGGAPSAIGSKAQAQKLQKLAPNVISVQPQSEIQKLPDVSVAEALQRVPGVQMESDTGEGRFINIRGMDADLNGTTFDGVHLTASNQSSPTGGARAVAMDAFPAGMVGGIEVTKSLTPDMDAEGLGGSVNMLPLEMPTDGNAFTNITAAAGEETLRHTGVFQGSVTAGDSFAIPGLRQFANPKPFSVIFNYSTAADRRGINDVESGGYNTDANNNPTSPQDLELRWYQAHRTRQGGGVIFAFDPDAQTHLYLQALAGGYDEQIQKNRLELDGIDGSQGTLTVNGNGTATATGVTARKVFTNSNEYIGNKLIALGGKTVIADVLTTDFRASYTEGYDDQTRSFGSKFKNSTPYTVTYSIDDPSDRSYTAYNASGTVVDLSDPALYKLSSVSNGPGRKLDQEFALAANGSFATSLPGGYTGQTKFGAQARLRTEGSYSESIGYDVQKDSLAALSTGNGNVQYYNNDYIIGPNVNYSALFGAISNPQADPTAVTGSYVHNSEDVYAAYVQETAEFGPLEALAGVRVEDTEGKYGSNATVTDLSGNTTYPWTVNKHSYVNVFPALQFKYRLNDQWQFRAAYSTGIARPGFQQLKAGDTVDYSQSPLVVTQGNPSLKPTTGNSFDLTAEYYPGYESLISVGGFYKFYNNYIVQTYNPNGTFQGQAAQITSYENIGGAYARGAEFDVEQKFFFLPAPFDGLGTDDNLTFVDSRGRYDTDGGGHFLSSNQLPETSPISGNASIVYEKGPISFRTAVSYVSRNLFSVGGAGRGTDVFSSPRLRLDMSASYDVNAHLEVFAEGKNLTNTALEFTQSASANTPIQREFYAQDFLVGIRAKFGG